MLPISTRAAVSRSGGDGGPSGVVRGCGCASHTRCVGAGDGWTVAGGRGLSGRTAENAGAGVSVSGERGRPGCSRLLALVRFSAATFVSLDSRRFGSRWFGSCRLAAVRSAGSTGADAASDGAAACSAPAFRLPAGSGGMVRAVSSAGRGGPVVERSPVAVCSANELRTDGASAVTGAAARPRTGPGGSERAALAAASGGPANGDRGARNTGVPSGGDRIREK